MDRLEYLDFEIKLEKREQGYAVSVIRSPAGEAEGEFVLPFSDLELENLLLKIGRTRRGVRRIGSPEWQAAMAFGGKLFEAVFKGDVRGCFRSSQDKATLEDKGLRIKLRLLDAPELADLPWEYLHNRPLNRFLSLSTQTPIVRYIELPAPIRPLAIKPPLHILVMVSSPSDYVELDVGQEKANLQSALSNLEQRGMVEIEWLEEATLRALQRRLRRERYHIFHFIGHGGFDKQAQDGLLLLEDQRGRGRRVSGQHLGVMLHDHRTLRLAVLNACEGARSSRTDPFAGVAMTLVQQGIPAVVAMQFEITDEAAIVFASEFYAAIADGYPVDASLAEARKAIFATGNDVEWGTPVLYMRSPDGQIFDLETQAQFREKDIELEARAKEQLKLSRIEQAIEEGKKAAAKKKEELLAKLEAERQVELAREEERQRLEAQRREQARQEKLSDFYAEGMHATKAKDWEATIAAFKQVVALDSRYRDAAARLATAEAEQKKADEKKQRKKRLADLYAEALRHFHAQRYQEAIEGFGAVAEIDPYYGDPTHGNATTLLAKAQQAARQREAQLTDLYEKAVGFKREREERLATFYDGAEEHYRKGKWAQAVESYEQVLALEPGYRDVEAKLVEAQRQQHLADKYAQALEHLQAQHWQEAIEGFRAVIEIDPYYGDPTRGNATTLLAKAQQEKEQAELPPPPAARPRKPTTLPEDIGPGGKPRDLPR